MFKHIKQTALITAIALGALGQTQAEEKEKKFYDPIPKKRRSITGLNVFRPVKAGAWERDELECVF